MTEEPTETIHVTWARSHLEQALTFLDNWWNTQWTDGTSAFPDFLMPARDLLRQHLNGDLGEFPPTRGEILDHVRMGGMVERYELGKGWVTVGLSPPWLECLPDRHLPCPGHRLRPFELRQARQQRRADGVRRRRITHDAAPTEIKVSFELTEFEARRIRDYWNGDHSMEPADPEEVLDRIKAAILEPLAALHEARRRKNALLDALRPNE